MATWLFEYVWGSLFLGVNKVANCWLEQDCDVLISFWNSPEIKKEKARTKNVNPFVFRGVGTIKGNLSSLIQDHWSTLKKTTVTYTSHQTRKNEQLEKNKNTYIFSKNATCSFFRVTRTDHPNGDHFSPLKTQDKDCLKNPAKKYVFLLFKGYPWTSSQPNKVTGRLRMIHGSRILYPWGKVWSKWNSSGVPPYPNEN